jgi:predicted RNA methylase
MSFIKRWFFCTLLWSLAALPAAAQEGKGDVVYVPTPQITVDEMLRMARVGPGDFLIDLGSGDGRIVITAAKQFGARGLGVDLDTYLLELAREGTVAIGAQKPLPWKAQRAARAGQRSGALDSVAGVLR